LYGKSPLPADMIDPSTLQPVLKSVRSRLIHVSPDAADKTPGLQGKHAFKVTGATGVVPFGRADGNRAPAAGRIAHATLDVTFPEPLPETHPLWQVPEVHLTPHVSFLGGDHLARFLEKTLANLTTYAQGAPLRDLFDRERGY
ncbi:MAG: hypothetical protein KJ943_09360, partial [Alphaproteobacteria bacterium]|nr:hypothetical protein [Alphaproteobacteria bacterium]